MFWQKIPIWFPGLLWLLSTAVFFYAWHGFLQQLAPCPVEKETGKREEWRLAFQETLLGFLIVLAVLYLTRWCVAGRGRDSVAVFFAYLAACLTSFGAFQRLRMAFQARMTAETTRKAHGFLALFCLANGLELAVFLTLILPFLLPEP